MVPCQREPEIFFAEYPRPLERAKALCAGCGMRDHCLAGALERREPYGVWGGEIVVRGQVVEHKRGRGRPRTRRIA